MTPRRTLRQMPVRIRLRTCRSLNRIFWPPPWSPLHRDARPNDSGVHAPTSTTRPLASLASVGGRDASANACWGWGKSGRRRGRVRASGGGRGCRGRRVAWCRRGWGRWSSGPMPDWVLGKAMTSRMFSSPARMATRRSMPKANPPCGGAPYLNGLRKKPKRFCASSSLMPEQAEDARLQLGLMDPDRARPELPTVEHQVVGLAAHLQRVGLQQVQVVGVRLAERVVAGLGPAGDRVDADEQREVDDPQVAVRPLVHRRAAEVVAQRAEHLARGRPLVGDDQQQVARLRPRGARSAPPARPRRGT